VDPFAIVAACRQPEALARDNDRFGKGAHEER